MKSITRTLVCLAFIVVLASAASSQTSNPARLKLRGVGLDSSYAQVVKTLGKPSKETAPTAEECIGGQEKDLEYDGISFRMMNGDSKGGKTFEVKSFEVTGSQYVVSGVRIGDAQTLVRKIFGRRFSTDKDPQTGETIWHYAMSDREGPGTTTFKFKNGKITYIASDYLVC